MSDQNVRALLEKQAALKRESAELEKQLQQARSAERQTVIQSIRQLMQTHGLSQADLQPRGYTSKSGDQAKKGQPVQAKYRDPASGKTWSGRGLQPNWLRDHVASGKTKESFLIHQ